MSLAVLHQCTHVEMMFSGWAKVRIGPMRERGALAHALVLVGPDHGFGQRVGQCLLAGKSLELLLVDDTVTGSGGSRSVFDRHRAGPSSPGGRLGGSTSDTTKRMPSRLKMMSAEMTSNHWKG